MRICAEAVRGGGGGAEGRFRILGWNDLGTAAIGGRGVGSGISVSGVGRNGGGGERLPRVVGALSLILGRGR